MKKFILLIMIIAISFCLYPSKKVQAESSEEIEQKLSDSVEDGLEGLDFSGLDNVINDLQEESDLFKNQDFSSVVKKLINGDYSGDYNTFGNYLISKILKEITSVLPLILIIVALAVISNIITNFKPNADSKGISDLTHFVCYALVIILAVSLIKNIVDITGGTLSKITTQMEIIFPILLTLLTAIGSVVSVSVYNPLVAVLTNGIGFIFSKVMYPIFLISFVFVIIGNLTSTVKLNKINTFLSSAFKWIVGFVFTIFAGFLTIQGISAGKYDSVSLKATRFAMKSYIPIVGGYLSDGIDYVLLSGILIKNAIGVAGLLLLATTIIVPIIKIVIIKLALQFTAGIVEPIGDGKISTFCESCNKILIFPIVIILSLSFMYLLAVGLMMCTVSGVI